MKQWEYSCVYWYLGERETGGGELDSLNRYGAEGWELVSVTCQARVWTGQDVEAYPGAFDLPNTTQTRGAHYRAYLRRQLP